MAKGLILIAMLVLGILAMGARMANGSRSAASNCYADGPGPSTPTIC